MQIITAYKNYLMNRGLTEEICKLYGIEWCHDATLRIPVKDVNNKILFSKFRQNPEHKTGPKYTYEKGSKASLFGAQFINLPPTNTVIITEGELDAVLVSSTLMTGGVIGVSSTGGCGTWNEEWNELLKGKEVIICYDSDGPGVLGGLKVHNKIPGSKIMFLPSDRAGTVPKDLTEYYQKTMFLSDYQFHTRITKLMMPTATEIFLPLDSTAISEKEKAKLQDEWLERLREANKKKKDNYWIKIVQEHINKLHAYRTVKRSKYVKNSERGDLDAAKEFPIPDLIRFRFGKAKCIWHQDDTPSLTYYADNNTVYCFGCQKSGDAVDVYMQLNHVSFKEAIKTLNNND